MKCMLKTEITTGNSMTSSLTQPPPARGKRGNSMAYNHKKWFIERNKNSGEQVKASRGAHITTQRADKCTQDDYHNKMKNALVPPCAMELNSAYIIQ